MRAIVHALSCALFGHSMALVDFPVARHITGIGMSDWPGYAEPLAQKLGYRNTYYHQEPFLDITDISEDDVASVDFIISTDVFEHVRPPVPVAFRNALRMLKPEGVMVFTVPYTVAGETVEHFPDLHDFDIEVREGRQVLVNRTRDGLEQVFTDLVFHGGPGDVLEMRHFSRSSLHRELAEAGFADVREMAEPNFEFGIWHSAPHSVPFVARREPPSFVVRDFGPQVLHRTAMAQSSVPPAIWIAHDPRPGAADLAVKIGGIGVASLVQGAAATTGVIPEPIASRNGSYPVLIEEPGRARPTAVGTLFVVD